MTPSSGLAAHLGQWAAGNRLAPLLPLDLLDELREMLEDGAHAAAEHLPAEAEPVRLNKRRLSALLDCETHLLASLDTFTAPNEALVVGACVDALVDHYVTTGRQDPDPYRLARQLLQAANDPGAHANLAWLDSQSSRDLDRIADDIADRRQALLADWPTFEAAWWPRTQERMAVVLAGGRVILEGRTDICLGGPPSPFPGVVIEVKSGEFFEHDLDDMRLYALLMALRDGTPPALVVTAVPGHQPIVDDVTGGYLEAAARRVRDALRAVGRLAGGAEPKVNPSWRCMRCPATACTHVGTRPVRAAGDAS